MTSRLALLIGLLLIAGCAPRAPVVTLTAPPDDARAARLIRDGCYHCLEQALEAATRSGDTRHAFEAAILLALRSKELALPAETWLERARALAAAEPSWLVFVEMADAIPPDRLSLSRDALFDIGRRRRVRDNLATWREALQEGPPDPFRAYLDVALICGFGTLKETEASFTGPLDEATSSPLVQFAIGHCDPTHRPRLTKLRAEHEAFVDADYALGRYALEDPVSPDAEEALRRFQAASAAFPGSPGIAVRLGNLHRVWEEWTTALGAYDAALAVAPDHPEATIGRAISLSHLERAPDAIDAATRLIDGGQWLLGEAYYWRAWNHLRLGNLPLAESDVARARTLMANAAVLVLSGAIEWRQKRHERAEKDFQDALTIDLGECEAAFDLGVVRDELRKPAEALAAFRQSGQCYDLSMTLRREAIARIQSGPGTDTLKARDSARHERVLADLVDRRREVTRLVEGLEKAIRPAGP